MFIYLGTEYVGSADIYNTKTQYNENIFSLPFK